MQMSNQQRTKIDGVNSGAECLEPKALADEGFAYKSPAPPPSDFPIAPHLSLLPSGWIVQNATLLRQPVRAFPIPVGRDFLSQGFMRTEAVVISDPAGSAMLLALPGECGGAEGFSLEDPVHLLVSAIFFRMAGADKLDLNAQRCPPDAQAGQARRTGRGEGAAVVGADHPRQSVAA